MNVICLIGRLTADPELRHTPSQLPVTTFAVAVDRKTKEKQTDFINVVAWRGTAEFICKYFHKGNRIALQGSLQSRQYEDKNGHKRTAYEVVANSVEFCESKQAQSQKPGFSAQDDYEEVVDDDLPF